MDLRWRDATRQPDGSVDWAWITLRLFIAWLFVGAMNTCIAVFCAGSYRGADELIAVFVTSIVVATVGSIFAMVLGCVLLFPAVGRWWRQSLLPAASLFFVGTALVLSGVEFAQKETDAGTGERITTVHITYIPGILIVNFCLAFAPVP